MADLDIFDESVSEDSMRDEYLIEVICQYEVLYYQVPVLLHDAPVLLIHDWSPQMVNPPLVIYTPFNQ